MSRFGPQIYRELTALATSLTATQVAFTLVVASLATWISVITYHTAKSIQSINHLGDEIDMCDGIICTNSACTTYECNPVDGVCVVTEHLNGCCESDLDCISVETNASCLLQTYCNLITNQCEVDLADPSQTTNCTQRIPCVTDDDCEVVSWSTCIASVCEENGFCNQTFTDGSECVTSEECGTGFKCRNCTCMPSEIDQCMDDSDCGMVEWSQCFQEFCELGTCFSRLNETSECVSSENCDPGFECRNCTCVEVLPCEDDSDCGVVEWSSCLTKICNATGFCEDRFSAGSTCASSENCEPGFECRNCNCQEETQCQVDSDCGTIDWTTCLERSCNATGFCEDVFSSGSTCASSENCPDGLECRDCSCQEKPQCLVDSDCGTIEWSSCLDRTCNATGSCEDVFSSGSTCASSENCGVGFKCENCTCIPSEIDQCIDDFDCGIVEWSQCFQEICDMGTCFSRLNGTSECVTSENCDTGFECRDCTCQEIVQCEVDSDCGTIDWTNCLEKNCNATGFCEDVFSSDSTCASSENCDPGFECRDCTCQEKTQCLVDLDCGVIEWTTCLEKNCNATGVCEDVFSSGSTCASSETCGVGFKCENCTCIPSEIDQCITDSDCGIVEWSQCFQEFCDMGTCFSRLNGTSECVTSENCDAGFECRGCTCQEIVQCESDSDCGTIDWTTCLEKNCNATGFCEDVFSSGSTCASSENCDPGFECRGCTCQEIVQCETNSDCGVIDWTTCLEKTCNATGFCEDVFSSGSTCASSENCDPGFECRDCNCQEETQCQVDSDCGTIDWTTCLERTCNATGFCEDVFSSGSICASSENCPDGFECQDCSCEEVTPCEVDADCGSITWTTCLSRVCSAGFCVDELSPGSTCSDSSPCSSGQFCNSTCQCEAVAPSELSIQDNMFTLFDDVDSSKELQFVLSRIATSTLYTPAIQYYDVPTAQIVVGEDQIGGTTGFDLNPVSHTPSMNYALSRNGRVVTLDFSTVTGTRSSQQVWETNIFIPPALRPPIELNFVIRIIDNSVFTSGLLLLRTEGNFRVLKIDGGPFGSSEGGFTLGFYSSSISWQLDGGG